jgi:hypothetical protein
MPPIAAIPPEITTSKPDKSHHELLCDRVGWLTGFNRHQHAFS